MKNIFLTFFFSLLIASCGSKGGLKNCEPTLALSPALVKPISSKGVTTSTLKTSRALLLASRNGEVKEFELTVNGTQIVDQRVDLPAGTWNLQMVFFSDYEGRSLPTAYVAFGEKNNANCNLDLDYNPSHFLYDEPADTTANPFLAATLSVPEGCQKKFDCDGDDVPNYWELVGLSNPFDAHSKPSQGPLVDIISPAYGDSVRDIVQIQAQAFSVGRGLRDLTLINPILSDEDGRPEFLKSTWDTRGLDKNQPFTLRFKTFDDQGNTQEFTQNVYVANGPRIVLRVTDFRPPNQVRLSWKVTDVDGGAISMDQGVGPINETGSLNVTFDTPTTYTLTAQRTSRVNGETRVFTEKSQVRATPFTGGLTGDRATPENIIKAYHASVQNILNVVLDD